MFKITYHVEDLDLRPIIHVAAFIQELVIMAIMLPAIKIDSVTPEDFSILINTNDECEKNLITREFEYKFAAFSKLGKQVLYDNGLDSESNTLFDVKEVKKF